MRSDSTALMWRLEFCSGGAEPVALGQRAVALLQVLVEGAGNPISKDRLIESVWPGLAIEESNLSRLRLVNQRIGFLRFAAPVDLQGGWHGGEVSGCGER